MNLILSGGGVKEKSVWSYKKFAEKVKEKAVLFVPFANDEMTYAESLEWFKNEVNDFGITNIHMIEDPQELTLELLKSFGGVYISGDVSADDCQELKEMFKSGQGYGNEPKYKETMNDILAAGFSEFSF